RQPGGAAQAGLSAAFARLGQNMPAPDPARQKGKQNYAGRIVATIFSCGVYFFWWLYNMMDDGNRHFLWNWPWEDSLAGAGPAIAPPAPATLFRAAHPPDNPPPARPSIPDCTPPPGPARV